MTETTSTQQVHDVIIIGSGPAGYTAAIYAARADLHPIILAGTLASGGELMNTTEVENFPGFPKAIMGPDLMEKMEQQAKNFGAEIIYEDAEHLTLEGEIKYLTSSEGQRYASRTIILAMGSAYRKLGLPNEEKFSGHGISWCATCDAFFFKNSPVAVVGGGDSALEEAIFLSKFASSVTVIHRRDQLRASKILQDRAFNNPKISFLWNSEVSQILGSDKLESIQVTNKRNGNQEPLEIAGLFIAIGNDPRTQLIQHQITLTPSGTIATQKPSSLTSLPGVFAAGDIIDPKYRQAVTAAASGCVAAIDVEDYLAQAIGEHSPQHSTAHLS